MQDTAIASIHGGRSVIFNLLSKVFIDVPNDINDQLIANTLESVISMAEFSENINMNNAAKIFRTFVLTNGPSVRQYLKITHLNRSRDFTSLFILGKQSISQYSSVYLSPEKLLKQDPWSYVKAYYAANGFKVADDCKIIEDHISIELQFMGLLCNQISEKLNIGDFDSSDKLLKVQFEFYQNHIQKWVFDYSNSIIRKDEELHSSFYTSFAYLLKGFITEDIKLLEELLN